MRTSLLLVSCLLASCASGGPLVGPPGPEGEAGAQGEPGKNGAQGSEGQQGPMGAAGAQADDSGALPMACVPAEQVSCGCLNGNVGAQVCNNDGSAYSMCDCPSMPEAGNTMEASVCSTFPQCQSGTYNGSMCSAAFVCDTSCATVEGPADGGTSCYCMPAGASNPANSGCPNDGKVHDYKWGFWQP